MEGWKLSEAEYINSTISEDEIWQIFNYIFSTRSVNRTSYKYGLLKALLESVFDTNMDGEINLEVIYTKFSRIYWSLVVKYKLIQGDKGVKGGKTSIEKICDKYIEEYPFTQYLDFDSLKEGLREKINRDILKQCKKYVVGALYGDSNGILYSFSKKYNYLKFNPNVYKFIKKYNSILLRLNNYEWIKYLEKVNPQENCYSIAIKLDEASKRGNLAMYKEFLYIKLKNTKCFYCGKEVNYDDIHVDHFVPWSFLRNDKLWNFVISCNRCNLSKNDKLAGNYFLDKIIYRDNNLKEKEYEIVKKDFSNYNQIMLNDIYKAAIFNGFDYGWKPKAIIKNKK